MKWIRRIVMVLIAAGIVGGVAWSFRPQPVPVDATAIESGPLMVTVNEDGKTRIKERFIVSTPLAGQLRRVELDEGDEIIAGETVLATILPDNPKLLDPRERAEAEARVSAAQAAVKRAQSGIDVVAAAKQIAETQYERIRELHEKDAVTDDRLEAVLLNMRSKQEEHRAAEFSLEVARFELAQAEAALERFDPTEEATGDHFEIRSPISGRVLRVLQESAAVLPAGTQLLELGDPTNLELEIDVLSTDAVKIDPGDTILIEHWGGEEPLTGTVRLIEPAAFTKISALGVEEQRVFVIGDIIESVGERSNLGDGFRFEARIVVWSGDDVLQVPTAALFRNGDDWSVFVVAEGKAELRRIELGHRNADAAEIVGGLQAGEQVVVYPSDRVQNGVEVLVR
ncbi:MAG: efflux RND transporter periplasmic adaptor subunit [Planctomycetota bacterium]|nr:MAG: efflux RND transporter periplasmic adaptor subunit [Planctomycetota bacterium]